MFLKYSTAYNLTQNHRQTFSLGIFWNQDLFRTIQRHSRSTGILTWRTAPFQSNESILLYSRPTFSRHMRVDWERYRFCSANEYCMGLRWTFVWSRQFSQLICCWRCRTCFCIWTSPGRLCPVTASLFTVNYAEIDGGCIVCVAWVVIAGHLLVQFWEQGPCSAREWLLWAFRLW
jgi:hypothetical protein